MRFRSVPSFSVNFRSFLLFGTASHASTFTTRKSDLLKVSKSTASSNSGSTFTLERSIFTAGSDSSFLSVFLPSAPPMLFIVGKTDSLTTLSRIVEYYTLFSKSLQLIITYYSVCICCISVAHHIILLHLIELNPQGLFPRICSNYVIIFLLLLFFSYQ